MKIEAIEASPALNSCPIVAAKLGEAGITRPTRVSTREGKKKREKKKKKTLGSQSPLHWQVVWTSEKEYPSPMPNDDGQ